MSASISIIALGFIIKPVQNFALFVAVSMWDINIRNVHEAWMEDKHAFPNIIFIIVSLT